MVSIIIPIYNAGPYLQRCLQSVQRQSYADIEVVMVDDGSTDHSATTAQSFVDTDRRFRLIRQDHLGQSAARNRGMESIKGEYLMFVDSDDWIDIDCVAILRMNMGTNDVLNYGFRRVSHDGIEQKRTYPRHSYQLVSSCMRMYRTAWFKQQALQFPIGVRYDDVFFSMALWAKRPVQRVLPYAGYNYRTTPHSVTSDKDLEARRKVYDLLAHQHGFRLRCIAMYLNIKLHLHFWKTDRI